MFKFNKRHIAKTVSWRIIGTFDTFIFTWLITRNIDEGIQLSAIATITKLVWYYIHEQVWFNSSIANSNKRHIYKTFSWRIIGTLDTIIIGWIITGNPLIGLKIGGFESITKMLLYFGHEKLWYKINFGLDMRIKRKRIKKTKQKKKFSK